MMINKSQGQTLQKIGLYLSKPVFSQGQLYVAMPRVTKKSELKILLKKNDGIPLGYTRNVVYKEVLNEVKRHSTNS